MLWRGLWPAFWPREFGHVVTVLYKLDSRVWTEMADSYILLRTPIFIARAIGGILDIIIWEIDIPILIAIRVIRVRGRLPYRHPLSSRHGWPEYSLSKVHAYTLHSRSRCSHQR